MSAWTEEERDDLCDALSKYSTKRALSDEARVDIVIRAVDRIMARRTRPAWLLAVSTPRWVRWVQR